MTTDRIQRVLDPAYRHDLQARDSEQIRAMKQECSAIETAVSYARRLAQARVEILEAEQSRRAEGGSITELIERLPTILAGDSERADPAHTRHAEPDEDILDLRWPDGREQLLADDSLANLPTLSDADLDATIDRLRDFERDLSNHRRALHEVIEALELEIATRAAAGD
jgi:hypothetical protein